MTFNNDYSDEKILKLLSNEWIKFSDLMDKLGCVRSTLKNRFLKDNEIKNLAIGKTKEIEIAGKKVEIKKIHGSSRYGYTYQIRLAD